MNTAKQQKPEPVITQTLQSGDGSRIIVIVEASARTKTDQATGAYYQQLFEVLNKFEQEQGTRQ